MLRVGDLVKVGQGSPSGRQGEVLGRIISFRRLKVSRIVSTGEIIRDARTAIIAGQPYPWHLNYLEKVVDRHAVM